MSRKALKVVVELKFRAVSCPGVHLPAKDDVYLSMCFMGQCRQSECLPAVFPLLFHEKMTFEKIFRRAVDPGDIAVMLEYETIRIELVQLIPPAGETLACFEEDARSFLFPEPKLVPSFSGVDREVLMIRASHFPGIAPRLEFSTTTTITECPPDAQIKVYPNEPMIPVMRRNSRRPRRPRTASPQKKRPQTARRRRSSRADREETHSDPRSQSLSPLRSGNTRRLAHGRLGSAAVSQPISNTTHPRSSMSSSWPGVGRSVAFTNSSSPLTRSFSTVRYSPTARRKSLSTGLAVSTPDDDSSSSETYDGHYGPDPSTPCSSYRKHAGRSRSQSSSYGEWEEIHERVRGLLTTPKAVRRLVCGATVSEVDEVLARRSISPGPP